VQGVGVLRMNVMAAQSMQYCWSAWVTNVPPPPLYSFLFCWLCHKELNFSLLWNCKLFIQTTHVEWRWNRGHCE
jgi:hypothetical protein